MLRIVIFPASMRIFWWCLACFCHFISIGSGLCIFQFFEACCSSPCYFCRVNYCTLFIFKGKAELGPAVADSLYLLLYTKLICHFCRFFLCIGICDNYIPVFFINSSYILDLKGVCFCVFHNLDRNGMLGIVITPLSVRIFWRGFTGLLYCVSIGSRFCEFQCCEIRSSRSLSCHCPYLILGIVFKDKTELRVTIISSFNLFLHSKLVFNLSLSSFLVGYIQCLPRIKSSSF